MKVRVIAMIKRRCILFTPLWLQPIHSVASSVRELGEKRKSLTAAVGASSIRAAAVYITEPRTL